MGDMGAEREVDAPAETSSDYFKPDRRPCRPYRRHAAPHARRNSSSHIRDVMEAWARAEIQGEESYADFEARVSEILTIAARPGRRVLCITSGRRDRG